MYDFSGKENNGFKVKYIEFYPRQDEVKGPRLAK